MIANFLDYASSIIEKDCVVAPKNNVVYLWLRKPCMVHCKDKKRLNVNTLFYLCFGVLDLLNEVDWESFDNETEIDYIPNYVEELISPQNYNGNMENCYNDRMFLLLTLAEFVRLLGEKETESIAEFIEDGIEKITYTDRFKDKEFLFGKRELMRRSLTEDSIVYLNGDSIHCSPYIKDKSNGLFDYVSDYYYDSNDKFSEHILQQSKPTDDEKAQAQIEQLQTRIEELEKKVAEKDEALAELEKAKENAETCARNPEEKAVPLSPIRIAKGYKQKAMVLLSAMYYAGYFRSEDSQITSRDHFVQTIMLYAFGDPKSGSIRQTIGNYEEYGGDFEAQKNGLFNALKETFEELKTYQNEEKKTKKPIRYR